jgi:dTDP-4-dehydrorhamnose reductase
MTWLITGGSGQLGQALSVVLKSRRIEFSAWDSKDLDIRSSQDSIQKIRRLAPSVVVNAAAWTDVDQAETDKGRAFQVNAEGPLNLAVATKGIGAKFAHISTDYVFSKGPRGPWQENDSPAPESVYGVAKAAGELAVLNLYSERSYIFRTAWLYSKWGKNFAKTMTRLAQSTEDEVRVVNDQIGQPTSAIDLANQVVNSLITEIPFGIYHATNSGQASWFDFAEAVFKLNGASTSRLVPVSSSEFVSRAVRPSYSVLGHEAWENTGKEGVPRMRFWKDALAFVMPEIILQVKAGK